MCFTFQNHDLKRLDGECCQRCVESKFYLNHFYALRAQIKYGDLVMHKINFPHVAEWII